MATVQRSTNSTFQAVNTVDFTSTKLSTKNMATPRSRLTPPPPPPQQAPLAASSGYRPHTTHEGSPTIKDENNSPPMISDAQDENEEDTKDDDRDSLEPADRSGGSGRSSGRVKKKKGTKFHCTGFGTCNLAFTRSEHLARHIRKHTGERPFMCHCGRWFSRLDNLRQHSSTVHADEDIPTTSLAATGTRYQRHGRPERVRPRSRAQSQSDIQPPTEQQLQPTPPELGSPMEDRRTRRRPDPIVVPQDGGQEEAAFNKYRDHTPPESPASSISTFSRPGAPYRQHRAAPYPAVSEVSSPAATPTSSRAGGMLDSPFSSPSNYSHRNSMYEGSSMAARRLSMPHPPTPSSFGSQVLPAPSPSFGNPSAGSRRDSLTSVIDDDRRRTWHFGTSVNVGYPRDIISPTTHSFARASIQSPRDSTHPITPSRSQHTDRLPSIHHVLQEFAPSTPEHQRASWAGDILERPGTSDLKRPFHEGISGVSSRRVAPGQVRSSHGRSISNIETRRWGAGHSNPFSGPWGDARDRREVSLQPNTPLSGECSARNSGYFGGVLSNIPSPREHRHSFGSSDSSVSEGIVTPVAVAIDASGPRILGEPGDAVFHPESPGKDYTDRPYEMIGVKKTGGSLSACDQRMDTGNLDEHITVSQDYPISRLDALVSAAAVAAKI